MQQIKEGVRELDLKKALIPVSLAAAAPECKEHQSPHEPLLCIEVNSFPRGYDKDPTDPADMVSNVYVLDAGSLLMWVEFMYRAGFEAFGPAPFFANLLGIAESVTLRGSDSSAVQAILNDLAAKTGKQPDQEPPTSEPATDHPRGMYL